MSNDNLALWRKLENSSTEDAISTLNRVFGEEGTGWGWDVISEGELKFEDLRCLILQVNSWYVNNGNKYFLPSTSHIGSLTADDSYDEVKARTIHKAILFSFSLLGLATKEQNQAGLNG